MSTEPSTSLLKISVVVPVYNSRNYLNKCVDSIINQTYGNLEVLLIDDGSSDGSSLICDEYTEKDTRVVVFHKTNSGVSAARNLGIENATGDFICFVDSDDWLEPDAFTHLMSRILKYNADVVIFEYFINYPGYEKVHRVPHLSSGTMDNATAIEATISPANRFAWSKLYARKLLENVRFNQKIHIGEDTLFACNALDHAGSIYYTSKPVYHYYLSQTSATRCTFNDKRLTGIDAYNELVKFCKWHYPEIVKTALAAYVSLIISVIMDLCKKRDYPGSKKTISDLVRVVRAYSVGILLSNKASLKLKIKTALCSISPMLTAALLKRNYRTG